MSNDFTKNYQDGTGLTEAQLDTAFQTVKPSRANLAFSTTGSTTKTILQSQGNNITPEWVSVSTAINEGTITEAAANKIVLASDLYCNDVGVYNIGMSYSSPTLTIHSADGSALSASNPAIAVMPSASSSTHGQTVILKLTSNVSFQDAGGSNDIEAQFGTKAATAWTQNRPFFLYIVNTDNSSSGCVLAISPLPNISNPPLAGSGGYGWIGNSTGLTEDNNLLYLTSSDPLTVGFRPKAQRIGVISMTKDGFEGWTVASSSNPAFGIGATKGIGHSFLFAAGQCLGSGSGTFFTGSNNPSWATPAGIRADYQFDSTGKILLEFNTQLAGNCTNGTTTDLLQLAIPYAEGVSGSGSNSAYFAGAIRFGGSTAVGTIFNMIDGAVTTLRVTDATVTDIRKNDLSSNSDDLIISVIYPAISDV